MSMLVKYSHRSQEKICFINKHNSPKSYIDADDLGKFDFRQIQSTLNVL